MLHLIKKSSLIVSLGVLFTCVLLGLSSAPIYAASGEDPSPEASSFDLVIPEEYQDPVYKSLAANDVRATHDVNDVYLILYDDIRPALRGSSSSSVYSLPRIAYYQQQIYNALYAQPTSVTVLDQILDNMLYAISSRYYTIPELQAMTWNQLVDLNSVEQNSYNKLNSISTQLTAINSNISGYIPWVNNGTFLGFKSTSDGAYLTSNGYLSGKVYFDFQITDATSSYMPGCVRVFLPAINPWESTGIANITDITTVDSNYQLDTFVEPVHNGYYLYIFNLTNFPRNDKFSVKMTCNFNRPSYYTVGTGNVYTLSSSTDHYQYLKTAFYQTKTANSIGSLDEAASSLAQYFVSPEKQAAETASQPVIDDTLSGFTGSGSAAAKTSDTGSMKNMSSSLQSGLDTGVSAGTAASVFSDNRLWGWFTQENSDLINNAYPAPVYESVRGSGDQIRDAYSHNQSDFEDMLRGSSW